MPDQVGFYDNLSGIANLRYTARLSGIPTGEIDSRINAAIARVGLAEVAAKAVKTYSRGMRQRLAIAEILMKQAQIAILDEPTGGLDPQATREFLELIRSLKHDGMTILLSSHLLDLVQSVCDRVALFNAGRLGLIGRVNDLLRDVLGGSHVIRLEATGHGLDEAIRAVPGVKRMTVEGGIFRIETTDDLRPDIARAVVRAGGGLISIAAGHASLEEVYTQYFEGVRDAA
jgi:ABC-2 type transport system ATP-binding protein